MITNFQLRRTTPDDVTALRQIHRAAFEALVQRVWGTKDEAWWREKFHEDYASGHMRAVEVEGTVVGFLSLISEVDATTTLEIIAITPAHQGTGLGTRIMREIMDSLPGPLRLSVVIGNRALAWYRRLGFREISRTDERVQLVFP